MFAASPTAYGPNLLARLLAARTLQQVDDCAKSAWILNGEGLVDDAEMKYLAPVIEHQRKALQTGSGFGRPPTDGSPSFSIRPVHRRPPIPKDKRATAWLRRRVLAKGCIIPTCIASVFTVGKLAVLAVIARAFIDRGSSRMSLPEIAARAGVGCTTARYAIRDAVRMGLISVCEHRINGVWSRPNTIRIVCERWLRWLKGRLGVSAPEKSTGQIAADCIGTPLRNLIPTIEIITFSLRSTVHQGWKGRANSPFWCGRTSFGNAERALE